MEKWLVGNKMEAWPRWLYLFHYAPGAKADIFPKGIKIYKQILDNASRHTRKQEIIDTIILIYDRRTHFHGEDGQWLGKKAQFMFKHRLKPQYLQDIREVAQRSIELTGKKAEARTLEVYMKLTEFGYKKGFVNKNAFKNAFVQIYKIIEYNIGKVRPKREKKYKSLKQKLLKIMISHELVVICEDAQYFADKFLSITPKDTLAINWSYKTLKKFECTSNRTFIRTAKKKYQYAPSAKLAEELITVLKQKGRYKEAVTYYKKLIDKTQAAAQQAEYHYALAQLLYNHLEQPQTALKHAQKSTSLKKNWGKPYLLAGKIYQSDQLSCPADTITITRQTQRDTTLATSPAGAQDTSSHQKIDTTLTLHTKDTLILPASHYLRWAALEQYKTAMEKDPSATKEAQQLLQPLTDELLPQQKIKDRFQLKAGTSYSLPCLNNATTTIYSREDFK